MSESENPMGVIGETVFASCSLNAEDQVAVSLVGENNRPEGVLVETCQYIGDDQDETLVELAQVLLGPGDARRIAAALLNAADQIDGTVPLCFYERPAE